MNELRVEVRQTPGEIACNFAELEDALKTQMQAYAGLEVTEDNIPERKKDIATLRKIKGAVDDERKKVEKEFSKPLNEFKDRVKNLTGILDKEIVRIDGEIKEFDRRRIEEKQKHIRELYTSAVGDYAEFLPLSVIKSSKWDNKTCSDTEITGAIQEMVLKVRSDLSAIKALASPFEEKLIAAYKASGNQLAVAIQKNTDFIEGAKEAERRAAEEAARRAKEEEARKIASEKQWEDTEQIPVVDTKTGEQVGSIVFPMNEPVMVIRVTGAENVEALRTFLEMSGIDYEEA